MKKIILLTALIGLPISLAAQEVPDPLTAGYSQCKFLPGKGCLLYTSDAADE